MLVHEVSVTSDSDWQLHVHESADVAPKKPPSRRPLLSSIDNQPSALIIIR